jgi:membrane protein implicated in regulation of membrane protease activity
MRRRRRRRPLDAGIPIPKRPYRDSVIVYGVLAALIVVVAYVTSGSVPRALIYAAAFFVIATAYNVWKFRARLAEEERRRAQQTRRTGRQGRNGSRPASRTRS